MGVGLFSKPKVTSSTFFWSLLRGGGGGVGQKVTKSDGGGFFLGLLSKSKVTLFMDGPQLCEVHLGFIYCSFLVSALANGMLVCQL